jgi:hypothetical protein
MRRAACTKELKKLISESIDTDIDCQPLLFFSVSDKTFHHQVKSGDLNPDSDPQIKR